MTVLDYIQLTRDKGEICRIIHDHVTREHDRLRVWRVMNLVGWLYLQGIRRFHVFDPENGRLEWTHIDEEGRAEFQLTEMLSTVNRIAGHLSGMDVLPSVMRQDDSLSSIRDRSIAQVVGDNITSGDQLDGVVPVVNHYFTYLGSCGVIGHLNDHPTIGLNADYEVIHPRELYPFPSLGQDYGKKRGLIRQRMVPLSMLKERFGARIAKNLKSMEAWRVRPGELFEDQNSDTDLTLPDFGRPRGSHPVPPGPGVENDDEWLTLVRVRELWLDGPADTCARYVMCSGDYLILDEDFTNVETYCPIGFGRFMENGTFHGAGIYQLLFSINREAEKLLKTLFNNIRGTNQYGILVLPEGSFNSRELLQETADDFKVVTYEPEGFGGDFRPFALQPNSLGDVPGRVAQFSREIMQQLTPLQDLVAEKGRVDSASGLQFLDEQIQQSITTPTKGLARVWGGAHRSAILRAIGKLTVSPRPLPMTRLNLDLAGVVIDPQSRQVQFAANPIRHAGKLKYGIRRTRARSETARKQEAMALHTVFSERGEQTLEDLIFLAMDEGLDFALPLREWRGSWEVIVNNILVLFGDGDVPGQIVYAPHTSKPEFQLRVVETFMSGPQMQVASPAVQDEFRGLRLDLLQFAGLALPAAVPNPDDVAMLTLLDQERAQLQASAQGGSQASLPPPQQSNGVL